LLFYGEIELAQNFGIKEQNKDAVRGFLFAGLVPMEITFFIVTSPAPLIT